MQESRGRERKENRGAPVWPLLWVAFSAPVVALLLQSPGGAWAAMLGYHACCLSAARVSGIAWGSRPRAAEILVWVITSLVLLVVISQLIPLVAILLQRARPGLESWGLHGLSGVLAFVWYVLVNPWIEEIFWRGALLAPPVERLVGRRAASWISTVGFVPYHAVVIHLLFGVEAWWFNGAVLAGSACWVGITRWRRSLVPAAVSHQMADLVVVLLYLRLGLA